MFYTNAAKSSLLCIRFIRRFETRIKKQQKNNVNNNMAVPSLISNLKSPIIYWYQNDAEIVLRIMIHDVDDYFLRVKTDEFEFSTTTTTITDKNVDYYVYLRLYGAVIAEKTIHRTTGREIKIYLSKVHKWTQWSRLLLSTLKSPQIFYDVDRIDTVKPEMSNFVWNENNFAEIKKNYNSTIMPDVPSSNDDEDSDDDGYNLLFD